MFKQIKGAVKMKAKGIIPLKIGSGYILDRVKKVRGWGEKDKKYKSYPQSAVIFRGLGYECYYRNSRTQREEMNLFVRNKLVYGASYSID